MKTNIRSLPLLLLLALFIITLFVSSGSAQADEPNYVFVVFETNVTRSGVEISDVNPQERRFYVSNLVAFPANDPGKLRRASKIADEYFTATVVEPMKAKGVEHQYYDDAIRINNSVVYRLDTRQEVDELRIKTLEELKEQGANVFTFNWAFEEKTNGLATSEPKLIHREPKTPLYGIQETRTPEPPKVQPRRKN